MHGCITFQVAYKNLSPSFLGHVRQFAVPYVQDGITNRSKLSLECCLSVAKMQKYATRTVVRDTLN